MDKYSYSRYLFLIILLLDSNLYRCSELFGFFPYALLLCFLFQCHLAEYAEHYMYIDYASICYYIRCVHSWKTVSRSIVHSHREQCDTS
jgi:hypothetical protein